MSSDAIDILKGRLIELSIKGQNIRNFTKKITVQESICSPYITAEFLIHDTEPGGGLVQKLQLVGGEPMHLEFDTPPGSVKGNKTYSKDMTLVSISEPQMSDTGRVKIYTISATTDEMMYDKANLVQKSVRNITGSDLIKQIVSEIMPGVNFVSQVADSLLSSGYEPFTIAGKHPFVAFDEIRRMMKYPQYKSGNTMLFRDADALVLAPLEHLMKSLQEEYKFIQKTTWGTSWRDIFEAENMVIDAKAQPRPGQGGGYTNILDTAEAYQQSRTSIDMNSGKININQVLKYFVENGVLRGLGLEQIAAPLLARFSTGQFGGRINQLITNFDRALQESDRVIKTDTEKLYAATAKGGPQYIVKVPMRGGLNVTVGKGVYVHLLPSYGDSSSTPSNAVDGLMLVTDVVHELWQDGRAEQATTTFQCIRGGFDYA